MNFKSISLVLLFALMHTASVRAQTSPERSNENYPLSTQLEDQSKIFPSWVPGDSSIASFLI